MSAPLRTGDIHDDDPQVIESFTQQAPEAPPPPLEPIAVVHPPAIPLTETRLLTGMQRFDPSWTTPIQLLPSDLNRKHIHIEVEGATATDAIALSSDPNNLSNVGGNINAGRLFSTERVTFDDHTGPLWAVPLGAEAGGLAKTPIQVSWWAVTS